MDRKNLLKGNDFFGNLKNSGILALVVIGVVLMFLMSSLMFLASGLNRILNFNKNNINLLKNFKIYKMIGYRTSLKLGGIFALIVGLIFIFSAVNVSAGGCCCYAGSCLNEINDTANVSAANAYLKVDKFVDKDIVQVGDTVGYTIIVRNLGNTTAYDVTVNDTLPIDISSVTLGDINYIYNINGNGGIPTCQFLSTTNNESGKVLYCKINKIPKKDETGANVTIFFGAKVTQHTNAPINHTNNVSVNGFYTPCLDTNGNIIKGDGTCPCTNLTNCNQVYGVSDIATVQTDQDGSNGYNDLRDNATVWIVGIDVTKYATTNSTLQAGDEVVFHITITNTGDLQVCNITVHDRLPSALEFVDSSPENSSPVTERDVYFNLGCLNGSLSTTINITTKVSTAATTLSSLSNFVEVNGTVYNASGNATDINVTDNYTTPPQYFDNETGTNQTPQIGKATLSLNKIAMDPWTRPTREIKYRVEVDTGGAMVYGAQITDHLPGAFQYMNNIIQLNDGECTPNSTTSSGSTGKVIFNLGNFTGKCIFEYTVYVPWNTKDGYYRNNQTLTANDKNNQTLANVTDNAPVIVDGNTRLTVNKDVVNPRIFQPNDIIEYTLTVSNEGDNEIHDVNVTDLIPYGMNYSSSWLEGGNVYIPGYDEAAIGSPACQITSQTCNTTHCNVTVGCCNNEIYTHNDILNGTSQTGSASCTNYNVSCNNSNASSCTISNSSTSTVQIIGDLKYTDPSKGYKAIWHFDIIGAKTTKVIHLNLTITSDSVGGSSMNKVEVTGITPNGDVLLWKDIASSARIGKANLLIEKSSDTATIAAGEEVTYTIRVKNIGEGYAQNITIKDEPGSQMQLGAISMASCNGGSLLSEKYEGGPATNYGDSVTYILKNVSLAPGKECVINYKAYTASTSQEGLYVNKATLNWRDMFGTEQMALSTTAAVMILPPDALMSIRKQSNATRAQPGEKLNYTITIENKGSETLRDVIINDTLPDGFKNLSQAYWGNFNCSNMPNGTCVRDINSNKSNYTGEGIGGFTTVTLSIEAIVTSNTTEGLNTNKVTITAKRPSGTPVKGSSSHILQVNKPHISITKWASTTMREPGQNVTFYIEVKNTGAGDAKNITITDDATPFEHIGNVSVVSGECTVNKSGDGNITTFWINDNGTFNAYKTCIFKYLMKVPANTSDGTYTNNASLSYQDLNNTEFSKSAGTDVLVTINLFPDVEKIANDTSLQPGDRVNFTINVRNYGSATMTNGTVTDTLPPGFRCLNASGITNGINCSCVNDTTAICNLTDLVGNTISNPLSMWVEAKVNGSATEGSNENNVSLNGTRPDGLPINRTTEAKVFVNEPKPQLEIYKWTDTIKATPNSTVIYYILVKNTGDGDVYNLTINDTMDFGSITSYSTIPNGCADCNTSTKSCNISHLSSAGQCQIKLIALINENATDGTHNNTVNVSGFMKGGTEINKTKLNDTESINVEADVKLTVTKKANTTEVNAGDNVTYTVIVRNDGVNRVMVNVTDNAPLGFTCVNKTHNESVWINGNSLETFTFECNVNSSATQGNNTVVVNGVAENNQTFDANGTTTIVLNTPKLEIIKEAVTGTVEQNGIATYKIIVRNTGTAPVKNISITDRGDGGGGTFTTALGGPSLDTAASTGCTGVNSSGLYPSNSSLHYHEVNFTTNGTMNPGQQCVFTYTLTVKSTAEIGNYANNATITGAYHPVDNSSYTPTPEPKDNATIRVIPQMNVSFTKTGNATAEPGQSVTFTINITNNNAGANMTDVVFNDTLPDGFNCTSNSTQRIPENTGLNINCSCDGRQINCNIGTIKNSSTVIINITADVNSSAELSSTNRANVTYNVTGTTLITTSEASHTVTILKPQLSVLKENNATGVIRPGQDVNYTITVKNSGGGTAYNISIRDVLDDGLTHTSVSNISCNGLTNSSTGTNAIDFNISSLANNSNCKFNITVHVPEQVNNSVFGNTINITDAQFGDGTHLNSTYGIGENATSDITVQAFTNVSVVKSANPTSAQPGDSINFTINVTNNGGNTVYNIKVDDILPYGFNPNCTTLSPGSCCDCNESTRKINCTFPNSTVLSVISANVTVNSSANPLSTHTANVSYDLPNGTTQQTDNPGQTTVTVNKPNLTIQKTPNNPKASRDQNISFEIRIKNIGTATAHNILLQDVLPSANMQHISNGTNVSGCSQLIIIANPLNTNTTTFTLDNLTAGQECIFNYTVYIDENISDGNYTNIATITGGKFGDDSYMDSSYGNNSNSNATVEVTTTIIPSIEKIPSNDKMQPGDTINFTIIIKNNGNNDWKNVAVKDVLPAGFIYNNTINVTPSTGGYTNITYNSTTRELNYTGVTVPKFGNWTVIVVANVTSGASSPSTHRVNASSPDNRSVATVATVVVDKPALIVSKEPLLLTYLPGDNATYRIKITNTGTGDAFNVTMEDAFADLKFYYNGNESISIAHCGTNNNTNVLITSGNGTNSAIFALNDTLAGQENCEFTYTVRVDERHEDGLYANNAKVNSTMGDGTKLPVAEDSAQVLIKADVSMRVTKTSNATDQKVNAGDYINFTITVYENGNSPIYDVNVSDTVPYGCVGTNVTNNSNVNGSWDGRNVNFIIGKINNRSHVDLNITCYINHSMTKGWNTNSVRVVAKKPNGDEIYGSASTQIRMLLPDISWTKESLNKTILAGQKVTYKIKVTNKGDGTAHNLTIVDYLPKGDEGNWTYASGTNINDSCGYNWNATNVSNDGNIVKFFLDKMNGSENPAGTECAFTFEVQIPHGTTSVMYANTIGGNWSYGDINNNTPKATNYISNQTPGESNVYVYAGGGIIIQKESDKEVYQYGDIINYTITVYSNGIPTTNLTVTDVIPKGLRLTECPGSAKTEPSAS